jgi:hypothetical protein
MEIKITITVEEYQRLRDHSAMLGRIAGVVSRYAHTPETTTYQCVVALNERVRKLNAKVRNHKARQLRSAVKWALGESGDFGPRPKGVGAYWWREELRQRAGISELNTLGQTAETE